jgi:hypothetical protein
MPVSTNEEDGARSAERFEASREVVWKMPKGGRPDGIEADAGASISREGGDLVLDAAGADELLYLPEMTYPTGSTLLLRIDLETGDEGILFVFYRTRYDPTYERRRALHRSFGKGRSAVFLVLPPAEETGRLALRLGSMQGRYRLHGIEIRREPD